MMDLLDLAQLENSTFKLNKEYFSMFNVIEKAFGLLTHVAKKKNVALKPPQQLDLNDFLYFSAIYGD